MALKTKTRFSSYNVMHGLSRVFRMIGWFVLCVTVGYSIPLFISDYQRFSSSSWYSDRALEHAANAPLILSFCGLIFAACVFLLSVALYTGLSLLAQRRTQIALLERLAREHREKLSPNQTLIMFETL